LHRHFISLLLLLKHLIQAGHGAGQYQNWIFAVFQRLRRINEPQAGHEAGHFTLSSPPKMRLAPNSFISLSAPVPSSLVHQFETLALEGKHSINLLAFQLVRLKSSLISQPEPNSLVHQFPMLSAPVRLTKKFRAGHRAGHFLPHPTPKIPERDIISPLTMSCSSAKRHKTSKI